MVLVHRVGLVEHDFDHIPGGLIPDQAADGPLIPLHETIAGLVAAVAGSRRLPEQRVTSPTGFGGALRIIRDTETATGLPAATPCASGRNGLFAAVRRACEGLGGCDRARSSHHRGPLSLTGATTLSIPFRDPFRIARDLGRDRAPSPSSRRWRTRTSCAIGRPGRAITGLGEGFPDAYYGETEATNRPPRSFPLFLSAVVPAWGAGAVHRVGEGDAAAARAALDDASRTRWTSGWGGPQWRREVRRGRGAPGSKNTARGLGIPLYALEGLSALDPPHRLHGGRSDEPAIVAERGRPRRRLPVSQGEGGRARGGGRGRNTGGVARGLRGADAPRGREHRAGSRRGREGWCPDLVRLGIAVPHRATVPPLTGSTTCRRTRRSRSSSTSAR